MSDKRFALCGHPIPPHNDECRAYGAAFDTKATEKSLGEGGFAGAQVAL
jgi:hypothetical protein